MRAMDDGVETVTSTLGLKMEGGLVLMLADADALGLGHGCRNSQKEALRQAFRTKARRQKKTTV
jgi:hypothetical protein